MQQEGGSATRQLDGDRLSQSIGRSGNQDDLFSQWSHLVLPVSRKSLSSRRRSWGRRRLFPALALVQFNQFLDRRRVLRLLVCLPEGDQPRKAQRITRLVSDFSRRMGGRARDLIGQHLQDQLRLDPHTRLDQRGDTSGTGIDFQPLGALAEYAAL